ncbi:hypothetical protein [Vibrio diazotrophicus]|nr:hypothetical protein [Vibrio diazotrophicus]
MRNFVYFGIRIIGENKKASEQCHWQQPSGGKDLDTYKKLSLELSF